MTKRNVHVGLFISLIVVVIIAVGFPHGNESWFEWLFPQKGQEQVQFLLFKEFRIPRILMALIAGAGLSISGLLLQTLFNNPLAGPSILGLTSGQPTIAVIPLQIFAISKAEFLHFKIKSSNSRKSRGG